MNIRNDIQPIQPLNRDIQVSPATRPTSSSDAVPLAISDQAHLSSAASLASRVASLPDVRTEKVQAIQVAIASGSYNVDAKNVARSMMDQMLGGKE